MSMEADVSCRKCGGILELKGGELVCSQCGLKAPHEPAPTYGELIARNKRLTDKISDIEKVLESEDTALHKVSEIELIIEDD